jgi:hypothetical protein
VVQLPGTAHVAACWQARHAAQVGGRGGADRCCFGGWVPDAQCSTGAPAMLQQGRNAQHKCIKAGCWMPLCCLSVWPPHAVPRDYGNGRTAECQPVWRACVSCSLPLSVFSAFCSVGIRLSILCPWCVMSATQPVLDGLCSCLASPCDTHTYVPWCTGKSCVRAPLQPSAVVAVLPAA